MSPPRKPAASSLRAKITEALATDSTREHLEQLFADIFATEKARLVNCPECGADFKPKLPDLPAQVSMIVTLMEQGEGKASTEPQADTVVVIERPAR
jgi:hypothetical protein